MLDDDNIISGGAGEHNEADMQEHDFTAQQGENVPEAEKTVTVQPVQFASFEDLDQIQGPANQNLNILLDVKLLLLLLIKLQVNLLNCMQMEN